MPGVKDMYRKSLLFEIIDRNNPSRVVEAFTLTVPPESFDVEEGHRITRTKTWGGLFIDDMGEDVYSIRISGHTGDSSVRKTYSPTNKDAMSRDYNGKTAFFYFRDKIMRYKTRNSDEYSNYDIYLYNLNSIPSNIALARGAVDSFADGYVVSLEKFKMRRSKEKPLFYNYDIELIGLRALGTFIGKVKPPTTFRDQAGLLQRVRRSLRLIQSYFTTVQNFFDQAEALIDLIGQIENKLASFIDQTGDLLYYPGSLVLQAGGALDSLGDDIENSYTEMMNRGKDEDEFYEVVSATRESQASINSMIVFSKTPNAVGNKKEKIDKEISRIDASMIRYEGFTEEESEKVDQVLAVNTDEIDIYTVYGYILVVVNASTTLQKLGLEYFNNPSFSYLIASYNKIEGDEELEIGKTIRIPVILKGKFPESNFIYSESALDVYGKDIKLDNNGSLVVAAAGDLAIIEGTDNLIQALNLRLNDKLGSRLRLAIYGIRDSVGFAMSSSAPMSYAICSIKDTLMQDPRVKDIRNLNINGSRDSLEVSMDVDTIKVGSIIPYKGEV